MNVQRFTSPREGVATPPSVEPAKPLPRERVVEAATALGVLAAYVALEWVSFIHEHKGVPITPWNPGLGLVFAMTILRGPIYGLVLFAGAIIAEIAVLRSNLAWPVIAGIAFAIAGGYGLVAAVARRNLQLDVGLNRLRDVFVLLASGLAGAILVASLIALLLIADSRIEWRDMIVAIAPLLVGDVIGIAVVTPLVLRLALSAHRLSGREAAIVSVESVLFVAVVGATLYAIAAAEGSEGLNYFHVLYLPIVVAAVRHGVNGACISLGFTQLALVALLHGFGYDAQAFTDFQIKMLVLSATGLVVGVVVTERHHAELAVRDVEARLRAKEAEAIEAARFNLVSGTAAALAHEINQPMTAARALSRSAQMLLRGSTPDLDRAEANLAKVVAQIDHAASVVKRMREFLRRGAPHRSTVEIGALLRDALALVRLSSGDTVRIALDVPANLPPIHADRVQLQQVVINLVRNAIEAIEAGGISDGEIRVMARRLDERDAPSRIEVAVADNGPGLAEAAAARLFEPLATSKSAGFGLGLSICASIVESHGGRIWLASARAGATEFRFSLPVEQR